MLSGCAAGIATGRLVVAEGALKRAKEREAAELAPYRFTLATRFLEKAREEHGDGEWKQVASLAHKAAEHAEAAIVEIESGTIEGREIGLELLDGSQSVDRVDRETEEQAWGVLDEKAPDQETIDLMEGEDPSYKDRDAEAAENPEFDSFDDDLDAEEQAPTESDEPAAPEAE